MRRRCLVADRRFTICEAEQRTPEWHAARLGRLTGSVAGDMLATLKSGGEAAGRANLRIRLVLERLTGKSQERDFVSDAMQTGIDREADAIAAYEALTGDGLLTCGFLSHLDLMAGTSPDAYMGDFDVLVSIKCRQPKAHWEFLRTGKIPADALAQNRHECWLAGAREHHYVSWNPDFPKQHRLKIEAWPAAKLDLPDYEKKALAFLAEVDAELKSIDGWKAEVAGVA
jgi:hypothetical protein